MSTASRHGHHPVAWLTELLSGIRRTYYFGLNTRVELYHLLSALARAKQPLTPVLEDLATAHRTAGLRSAKALFGIHRTLKLGKTFLDAFKPWVPTNELVIIQAADGNQAGEAFSALATITTAMRDILGSLVAAFSYPALLIGMIFVSMRAMHQDMVVPVVKTIDVAMLLPETRYWMQLVAFGSDYRWQIVMATMVVITVMVLSFSTWTGPVRGFFDRWVPPYIFYREITAARFVLAFVALQVSGTPVAEAVRLLSEHGSRYFRSMTHPIYVAAIRGQSDPKAFRSPMLDPNTSVALGKLVSTRDVATALPRIADALISSTHRRIKRIAGMVTGASLIVVALYILATFLAMQDFGTVTANLTKV